MSVTSDTIAASCRGTNHSDHGRFGRCDACNARVVRVSDGRVCNVHYAGDYGTETYYCWNRHQCDPAAVTANAEVVAARIASGEIVKGSVVTVVKGRKVPVGTVGTVFWTGEDNYGNAKIGIRTESGEKFFTAQSNVEA